MNQTAMQVNTRGPLYWTARRICHERDLPPEYFNNVLLDLVQREFLLRVKPFVDLKVKVEMTTIHFSIYPSGIVRHYSPEQQEIMDECDKQIKAIAQRLSEQEGVPLAIGGIE